ncbi:MAG TPA: ABC transporter permease [Gaiellaceae bacterium]|jgi:lipopolysaccharide transport system permease protein|nr:ABC transporter permease [Gaiellaceae bacterium]
MSLTTPEETALIAPERDRKHESHFDAARVTVIRPQRRLISFGFKDIWDYRDLLYLLVWRDVKVRYKQTVIGFAWAVLQPVVSMIVFTLIFGRGAHLATGGVPYPILTYTALLPWQFMSTGLTTSTTSIVSSQALVTKVYFPRLLIPIGPVISGLVDFFAGLGVLVLLMIYYHVHVGWTVLMLPVFLLFAMAVAATVGIWLSALNVRYRDIQYAVPFLVQILFFVSPIAYSTLVFPPWIRPYLGINPIAGVVTGFRWALLGNQAAQVGSIIFVSLGMMVVLLLAGIAFFRRVERSFADVV